MMLMEIGFWVCLGIVIYIYVGYLACVCLLASIVRRNINKADVEPTVTVVISAYNEEREIKDTILNKLSQDYPSDRLEVIVVSDGSTDRTDEIVRNLVDCNNRRVKLLRQEPRQGKTQALNLALRNTLTDIVVFADANSIYAPNAVRTLVRSFADPSVGYVTGQMVYSHSADAGVGKGSGLYISYENLLRTLETKLGSIVRADGGIDAVRRELYVPMNPDQLPDFVLPLSVIEQGRRAVYEPDAMICEQALTNATSEFRMRVRVSLRALWALYDKRSLFNPVRYPLFAWQLASHKLLRYGAFLPLLGVYLLNASVVGEMQVYAWFLGLQLIGYAFAVLGHLYTPSLTKASIFLAPYYFLVLNAACVVAFWMFLNGQRVVLWKPRLGTV